MIVIGLAFLICVIGLIIYLTAANPKVMRVGEIMFALGLYACLCCGQAQLLRLFGSRY
jgi:hypothetical protein